MAGGYTPAMKKPVAARARRASPKLSAIATDAYAAAAPSDAAKKTRRAGTMSDRFVIALMSAPMTKPICTAMVRRDDSTLPSAQRSRSAGSTADAENHVLIESTIASANKASARHFDGSAALLTAVSSPREDPP